MKIFIYFSVLLSCLSNYHVQGQLLSLIVDALNPIYEAFSDPNGRNPGFQTPPPGHLQGQFPGIDPGTQFPQATGRDELFPADCGRHTHDGTGKMCFPDGILCQNSKLIKFLNCILGIVSRESVPPGIGAPGNQSPWKSGPGNRLRGINSGTQFPQATGRDEYSLLNT
jgi:hypothetical protein